MRLLLQSTLMRNHGIGRPCRYLLCPQLPVMLSFLLCLTAHGKRGLVGAQALIACLCGCVRPVLSRRSFVGHPADYSRARVTSQRHGTQKEISGREVRPTGVKPCGLRKPTVPCFKPLLTVQPDASKLFQKVRGVGEWDVQLRGHVDPRE